MWLLLYSPLRQQNNIRNRFGANANTTSGFRGVTWDKNRNLWIAQIMKNRKHIHLGRFDSKNDAAIAVGKAVKKRFGEFAGII